MTLQDNFVTALQFQFTHPRGVRCKAARDYRHVVGFNSRTREGCDFSVVSIPNRIKFQFTHPRGVRCYSR